MKMSSLYWIHGRWDCFLSGKTRRGKGGREEVKERGGGGREIREGWGKEKRCCAGRGKDVGELLGIIDEAQAYVDVAVKEMI